MYQFLKKVLGFAIKIDVSARKNLKDESFLSYLGTKISDMENGFRLNGGRRYALNSIANYRKIYMLWHDFEAVYGRPGLRFSQITMDTYSAFMGYCDIRGYKESTKYQYVSLVKTVMSEAFEDGVSKNIIHKSKGFVTHRDLSGGKKVYLTPDEIHAIEKLDLSRGSLLDKARDVFLAGYYTGQRFSDYSTISLKEVDTVEIDGVGYKVLRKRQKKTGNQVIIPILNGNLLAIIEKWGGKLPGISISTLNEKIKIICRMAGINSIVSARENSSGDGLAYEHKWELVSSHTARRSCLTNLHLEGKLTPEQIRSISGHRSERSYKQYLCQSSEEEAKEILKKYLYNIQ